jgi:predicted cupin superfamily sugar epimerase
VDLGQVPQILIPAGTWMGFVRMDDPEYDWGLYGVMVAPAWHIDDIAMAGTPDEVKPLMDRFPAAVPRGRELGLFPLDP